MQLPEEFKLEPKTIKNQGSVSSCVAHSLSSYLELSDSNNIVYSTGWIYGYRPVGYYQGEGMYMREAIKTLQQQGSVENKDFDYNIEMKEAKYRVEENLSLLETLAAEHKVESYARLYSDQEIKSWIFTKHCPVPMSIATDNIKLDSNNIIQIPTAKPYCGHAMLIIGWNEFGFIVQNSWGEDWRRSWYSNSTL